MQRLNDIFINKVVYASFLIIILLIDYASTISITKRDLSINMYAEDGQISQILYASKAVDKSSPIISYIYNNTSIIISIRIIPKNYLNILETSQTMNIFDDNVVAVANGYDPDIRATLSYLNLIVQSYHLNFGDTPNIDYMSSKLSSWITRGLYPNENDDEDILSRPLAVSILLSSFDQIQNRIRIVKIENSGKIIDCKFATIGSISAPSVGKIYNIIRANDDSISFNLNTSSNMDTSYVVEISRSEQIIQEIVNFIEQKLELQLNNLDDDLILEYDCAIVTQSTVYSANRLNITEIIQFVSNHTQTN